jgi:trans-aconitate methyltransferase
VNLIVKTGHKILANRYAYSSYQFCVGGTQFRKRTVLKQTESIRPRGILDLGCGPGPTLDSIDSSIGFSGIDLSRDYLTLAKKKRHDANLILGDVTDSEFFHKVPPEHLDLVLAMGLFHHLSDEQVTNLLDNLYDHLNTDSVIVSVDPTFLSSTSKSARWFAENDRGRFVRKPRDLEKLFDPLRFDVKSIFSQNEFRIPLDTIEMHIRLR